MSKLPFFRRAGIGTGLVLLVLLGACQNREVLSLASLRPPVADVPGATRMQIKSEVKVADYPAGDEAPVTIRGLRLQNVEESAYYKYFLGGEKGAAYKLKISIYTDAAGRQKAWSHQYPPFILEAGEPRDWGDGGFIVPGRMGAFGLGRVNVQVEASGAAPELEAVLQLLLQRARRLRQ